MYKLKKRPENISKDVWKKMPMIQKSDPYQISYDEYADRYNARQMTNEVNERVLAREVTQQISQSTRADGKPRTRLSGREFMLLKYDIRNKTKLMKRVAKQKGVILTQQELENPVVRSQYGGTGERGIASEVEKEYRATARAKIANQAMTYEQRKETLKAAYKVARAEAEAKGHPRTKTGKKTGLAGVPITRPNIPPREEKRET
jgi:hypothetical protein